MVPSLAVIGGGISGLATAIRMRYYKWNVVLYEKNSQLGGKLNEIKLDDYRFDTGPSLFTLPELVYEIFEMYGKNISDYIQVHELETSCKYFWEDGTLINAWTKKEKFLQELEDLNMDTQAVKEYLYDMETLYESSSDFFLFNSIHQLSTYVSEAGRKSLGGFDKMDLMSTMHSKNRKTFTNDKLVQLFDRYATYNGSNPYKAPAALNMISHLEHNIGAYFPKNGMYSIIKGLTQLAFEIGVEINFNTPVKEIAMSSNRAIGVRLDNNELVPFDLIVNATDVKYFYSHLLKDTKKFNKLNKREASSSALIFYWGMDLQSDLDVHNVLFSEDYKTEFTQLFDKKDFAEDLSVYIFISSKINPQDAPNGKENWFVMVNAPSNPDINWENTSPIIRKRILDKIQKVLKIDASKHIECESVLTPEILEQRTGSMYGAIYGNASNSISSAFLRHANFSREYKNLYFVGGSVHPGGGIPLCLASAEIVEKVIIDKYYRKFLKDGMGNEANS